MIYLTRNLFVSLVFEFSIFNILTFDSFMFENAYFHKLPTKLC